MQGFICHHAFRNRSCRQVPAGKNEKGCYFLGFAAAGFFASCFFAGAIIPVFVLFAAAFVSFLGITISSSFLSLSRARS